MAELVRHAPLRPMEAQAGANPLSTHEAISPCPEEWQGPPSLMSGNGLLGTVKQTEQAEEALHSSLVTLLKDKEQQLRKCVQTWTPYVDCAEEQVWRVFSVGGTRSSDDGLLGKLCRWSARAHTVCWRVV